MTEFDDIHEQIALGQPITNNEVLLGLLWGRIVHKEWGQAVWYWQRVPAATKTEMGIESVLNNLHSTYGIGIEKKGQTTAQRTKSAEDRFMMITTIEDFAQKYGLTLHFGLGS